MSGKTFEEIVDAIEQDNQIYKTDWSRFNDVKEIEDTYGELEESQYKNANVERQFFYALIRDNGAGLDLYLKSLKENDYNCAAFNYLRSLKNR